MTHTPHTIGRMRSRAEACTICLRGLMLAMAMMLFIGCASQEEDGDIPLPGFGDGPGGPRGVYAVIRRVDVPLNEPTDAAWALVNEQVVPPLTRGAWRGNGIRLGLLHRDQLDAYAQAMPQPVAFGEQLMNRSDYPVPIYESPQLRKELRFEIDLTRPPKPRQVETISGNEKSTIRLLARIVKQEDGRHALVLTPHHYIPSQFDLIPRDPLDKAMDGRVFDELTIQLTPGDKQIIVVGLYWPWPGIELPKPAEPTEADPEDEREEENPAEDPPAPEPANEIEPPAIEPDDPAAPPPHLRGPLPDTPTTPTAEADEDTEPFVAPPLPTHFGSTLFTGTRIRQQVHSVLLITIESPPERAE